MPRITDDKRARADVELAVLSAYAHGSGPRALEVAVPTTHALAALASVDAERSGVYLDLVLRGLNSAARTALEAVMKSTYEYQSDFMKQLAARGLEEGRARGLAEGRAEGRAEGLVEGEASALLRVLSARGFAVDAETERRVRACTDLPLLERWVTRAVTAGSLADVFE